MLLQCVDKRCFGLIMLGSNHLSHHGFVRNIHAAMTNHEHEVVIRYFSRDSSLSLPISLHVSRYLSVCRHIYSLYIWYPISFRTHMRPTL